MRGLSSEWGRRPDDPLAQWNKPKAPRAKKDRRRWCRGKEGVPHVVEVVVDTYMGRACRSYKMGRWVNYTDHKEWVIVGERWFCMHIERCTECGKKLRSFSPNECPTRPVIPNA